MKKSASMLIVSFIFAAVAAAAGPNIVVTAFPKGLVQVSGGAAATDSFTIANTGTADASVSFGRSGNFFTVSPSSTIVPPGASQVVTIRGTSQAGGVFLGSVTINGNGLPPTGITIGVRLMSGPVPAGTVDPQPSVVRVDVAGPPDQVHPSGASFHNNGNAAMQGIAVGDASWIVPQTEIVNIAAARNGQAAFNIDPTKRPDAPSPLGGVEGTLSLRFLNGNAADKTVSVSIVDVVRPGVSPGEPAPLNPGELALFVPALSSRNQALSDLFLAARRGEPAITDLKLYYAQAIAGSSSLTAAISQPPTGLALWFPSILQSVFSRAEQVGTIQLRGSQTTNVSVAAVQITTSGDSRLFSTPLPILRSDRAMAPGETLLLSGVEKSASVNTTVHLQEMSGNAATVQTEFFDATGAPVGSRRSDTVNAFRSVELPDVVPSGARSVRLSNVSGGRIGAAALISDNATQAAWPVIDSVRNSSAGTGFWAIPLIAPPVGSSQADIFVTNTSSASVTFSLENLTVSPPARRRAIRSTAIIQNATLRPLETTRTTMPTTNKMMRLAGPPGSISASGRVTITMTGRLGTFGGALPVVPLSAALSSSQGTRFTGVDDTALGQRSSLILAEVGGLPATVRVTLRYIFVAGPAISSQAISSKDFSVAAGQMLIISNLAGAVIGSQRDSFGDLRNMQVDVDVLSGSGRILPFIEGVDATSGNIMVRAE
jgi:hypothetical protein